ncbi:restriction endonuclease [Halodesulfurarchaeum sp. HSR-GB]|uniref:restriction endonuclease n=1 Tax=Halodesulfurarchaeum sp. HSR-GB TaxID=3074077 RepID=UPI002862F417|nr:restriction endonuclease [Halodesulfurarchaeum sp. HSR-GB]MDR5657704.1 restriction endonuclease [Halodesulfurarchaeum sp. HSR-GB]
MGDEEFEYFVADLWAAHGWQTEVTDVSRDAGVDVIARKDLPVDQEIVIQAKRYGNNSTVSGPDIQQYHSLKRQEDADSVAVITTGEFTSDAEERADDLDVKLVDGPQLARLVKESGGKDVIADYRRSNTGPREVAQTVSESVYSLPHLIFGTRADEGNRFFGITPFGYLIPVSVVVLLSWLGMIYPSLPLASETWSTLGWLFVPAGMALLIADNRGVAIPFTSKKLKRGAWVVLSLLTLGWALIAYVLFVIEDVTIE